MSTHWSGFRVTWPFTLTRPACIQLRASTREPTPAFDNPRSSVLRGRFLDSTRLNVLHQVPPRMSGFSARLRRYRQKEDRIMKSLKTIAFAAAAATFLAAGTASAARPTSLANTTWTLQTNQEVITLVITTQGGPGAP